MVLHSFTTVNTDEFLYSRTFLCERYIHACRVLIAIDKRTGEPVNATINKKAFR